MGLFFCRHLWYDRKKNGDDTLVYYNGEIFVDGRFVHGGFFVKNGRFGTVFEGQYCGDGVDLQGAFVIPGLVDIYVRSCGGGEFVRGDYDGLVTMARSLAKRGVTAFAPTAGPLSYGEIEQALSAVVLLRRNLPGDCAWPGAVHMAAPVSRDGRPNFVTFRSLFEFMGGIIGMVDVDPKADGAKEFADKAKKLCAVSVTAGETEPVYTRLRNALANGVPREEAVLDATLRPARQIGRDYEVGSVTKYKRADFLICDEELNIRQIYLGGEPVQTKAE